MRSTQQVLLPTPRPGAGGDALPEVTAPRPVWDRFVHVFSFEQPDDVVLASDTEVLSRLRDCEALVSQVTAEQSRWLRELRRRRRAAQAELHGHQPDQCTGACCDDDGWIALEVGVELGLSERQVDSRLETAQRLERHPAVESALDDGRLQAWTATRFLDHLDTLAEYVSLRQLAQAEAATLAWLLAKPRTVGQLNARMRRLILSARAAARRDTEPDEGAPDPGHAGRRVTVIPSSTPGLAELIALLPEADALAIRATLLALGHDRSDAADPRTADQRRADLLVTLLTGGLALHGRRQDARCATRDPVDLSLRLEVTLPVDGLGGDPQPARVPGYGDIPAVTACDLAGAVHAAGGRCEGQPLVYDPATGRLLGFGATPVRMTWLADLRPSLGYAHSPSLDRAVRLRDGTCRAPGCLRPAARCDCDHVTPWPDGPTTLANTCCLCRRHHRLKTHAPGWQTAIDTDGRVTWTTPTGRRVTTEPVDHRPVAIPDDFDPPPF